MLKPRPPEPYLGKSINYWLTDGFSIPPGADDRPPAESAFRCMGSNAVPLLIADLGKSDGPLKRIYSRKQAPRPVSADTVRGRAVLALAIIGPSAKAAIPALLSELTNDPGGMRRANTVVCLDAIDNGDYQERVVAAVMRARTDPDSRVARAAIGVLERRFPLGVLPRGTRR